MGMRHTFEADHIAAMASLPARNISLKHAAFQGVIWGVGHTLTLLFFWITGDHVEYTAIGAIFSVAGIYCRCNVDFSWHRGVQRYC